MPNTNCNVIKDLLPSYMEELCSKESRQLIDEHFTECKQCQHLYLELKKESSKKELYETKEFDYFKKIRNSVFRKNVIINFMIALLFWFQFYCIFNHYRFSTQFVNVVNYILPLLIIAILFFTLPDYALKEVPNKLKFTVLGIEFAIMIYITGLFVYIMHTLKSNILPFGLEPSQIGPFLGNQLIALQIAFTIVFSITLYLSTRKKRICPALHFLPIGGFVLTNQYLIMVHNLVNTVSIQVILRPFLIITVGITILVGLYMAINKKHL